MQVHEIYLLKKKMLFDAHILIDFTDNMDSILYDITLKNIKKMSMLKKFFLHK